MGDNSGSFYNSILRSCFCTSPKITDTITQTNAKVLGEAPAMAMGSLYQTIGNSVAMAAANAVYAQQQANVTYQAASTMGVAKLLNLSIIGGVG